MLTHYIYAHSPRRSAKIKSVAQYTMTDTLIASLISAITSITIFQVLSAL